MKKNPIAYFSRSLGTVVGLVMIWRGIWYILDGLDIHIFGSSHIFTAVGGVIIGLLILYLPDKDLKEIEKL
ncbi:MAG: hypothetical protein HYX20_00115 [Candidatus Yanofskybacteria bacterium]|nr:hypothetical protein [Candidatus Yanofskybacteria bacterium]